MLVDWKLHCFPSNSAFFTACINSSVNIWAAQQWLLHSFFFFVARFHVVVQAWSLPWATSMRGAESKFSICTGLLAGREGSFTG